MVAYPSIYINKEVSQHQAETKKVTTLRLTAMKAQGEPISMLTAYDYTMARLLDAAGIDILLVGDSAANVMAGHTTTLPITLDQMIYHGACVVRGVQRAFVVVDMPFGSYQISPETALASAIRIMKETGADAVKLEEVRTSSAQSASSQRQVFPSLVTLVSRLNLYISSEAMDFKAKKEQPQTSSSKKLSGWSVLVAAL